MKILLTNDDGYFAGGILSLADKLHKAGHEVIVCAPEGEKSGAGHSITFVNDFVYRSHDLVDGVKVYSLNGTPVDCVRFAVKVLCPDADAVVSGINNILNIGTDYLYSGTVNGAIEGALCGKKSLAVSTNSFDGDYEFPSTFTVDNLDKLLEYANENLIINLNIPFNKKELNKGISVCHAGFREYNDNYVPIAEGGEGKVYRLVGECPSMERSKLSNDASMSDKGFITITPVVCYFSDDLVVRSLSKEKFVL